MATATSQTGAPVELKIGDTVYLMTPLLDRHIAYLTSWLRKQSMKAMMDSMPEELDERREEVYVRSAQAQVSRLQFLSNDGAKAAGTLEGLSQIMFCMGQKHQPALKAEDWAKMLTSEEAIDGANDAFNEANNGFGSGEEPGKRKKRPKRKQKKKRGRKGTKR